MVEMRTLRVLAILTKRQMIDNAAYLVPALAFPLAFIPAIVIVVLTAEFTAPSLHAVAVFVALPVLVGLGSCTLGIVQTRGDRVNGVSELLSILAVSRYQVFCARLAVGIAFLLIALVPLMLAGSILWRFVGPPAWLVHDWQADVFAGMGLLALTPYCLGFSAGTRARTSLRAFAAAPLALLLVLLVVVKGFGWPLLSVLLVILVAFILESVRSRLPACVAASALGLLVLVFISTVLYCGRFLNDVRLARQGYESIAVDLSGLLAQKGDTSNSLPDLGVHVNWANWQLLEASSLYNNLYRGPGVLSRLCSRFRGSEHLLRRLGISEYLRSRKRGNCYANGGAWEGFDFAHLDCADGQLVYRYNGARHQDPAFPWDWERAGVRYIGPQGVSDVPTGEIGRFGASIIGASELTENPGWWSMRPARYDLNAFTLFEIQSGCFFSIDLQERTVSRGPKLEPRSDEPVQMGAVPRRDTCCIDVPPSRTGQASQAIGPARSPYVPVVCKSGRVELLDRDTLEIVGSAGRLPRPPTLFGRGSAEPRDLLASDVVLIALGMPRKNQTMDRLERGEYVGAVAASVSRQGTSLSVNVFDKDGKIIESHQKEARLRVRYLIGKYLFESLHPPALTLASFFTAYSFEAGSTHRALFLMPNSFVALQRDRETSFVFQLLFVLLFLVPALAFAGFLSWRVVRDAALIGLSRQARWLWGPGTLAFGLPAYVTYRLVRPKVALALCSDCGRGRRVDRETCHHCGSGWEKPVLNAPAGRIVSS
jgi:hypothetical protein